MALQYLLAPTFQFVNTAGKPLSGGAYMEVYVHGTRTKYFCASDFDGTLHPFRIPLDSLGSNIVLVNDTGSYDVYAYNRYGTLMMSRYNVKPGAGGGIGGTITSTDGSIDIHPTEDGVDLSVNGLDPSCLKVSADPRTTDGKFHFDTLVQEGDQAYVDNEGAIRLIKGWYHFTANVQLAWNAGARNETHQITLYTTLSNSVIDFDISHVHTETIELSGDVSIAEDGSELVIGVSGMPTGLEASVVGMDVHAITGKDGHDKYYAGNGITISNENYISADFDEVQEKLVAGQGVTIEGNVISAPSLVQVNSDWNATSGVAEILNKPDLDVFATKTEVNAGLAGKQNTIPDLAAIRSGAQAGASAVQPADLANVATTGSYDDLNNRPNLTVYATKTEVNTGLAAKQDVISDLSAIRSGAAAGATAVQPAALDSYATKVELNTGLSGKQDTINDLSTIRSGAAAGATALQPSDVATVATTGDYADLSNKPTIPSGAQLVPSATSVDADKVLTVDSQGIPGWAVLPEQPTGLFEAVYGTTSYADIAQAITDKRIVYCRVDQGSGRARMAFLAYDFGYAAEFQYYRSISSHSASAQTDEVIIYTVNSIGWSTTIRKTGPKVTAGTHMSQSYSNDTLTLNATWPTVDQTYDASSTNAQSGTAVAGAISTKQDTISDLATIRSGAAAGATAVQPGDLAVVATTGSYDDLSNKPTINNVPAVTSSDNDKVLKASYSGGIGSYSWQTEQGGGSTYTAGDAIEIDNDEINVLYDSDTMELKSQEQTYTFALGTWDENYGRAYAQTTSDIRDILEGAPGWELTLHIPANTFYLNGTYGENIVLRISDDQYFNYSNYCLTPLAVTYDSVENKTWIDEQDIVLHTPDQDPDYWHISSDHSARYVAFAPTSGSNLCTITSVAAGNNVTVTFTHVGGDPLLAVKNPLPASAIGDATKVLTVDNTGAPVWATAQAPISAGTGIDITNNVVSVDTSVVATQTDLAGKQDTISDLATIRSGAAEGATAVQPGDLATVATTGSYDDLADKPTIPAAQVNSDWNSNSGVSQILNKPTLATVATTGDYDDLSNKPSIPAAQVNSDWNAVSGVSEILNKPSIPTATSDLTNDSGFITLSDVPAQVNADWNSSSGASEILNKPTIPSGSQLVPAATSADADKVLTVDAQGVPGWATGGGTQIQSDWTEADSSAPSYIENKPVPKTLTAGTGISITENQSTITIANTAPDLPIGSWEDVSTEAQYNTTPVLAGGFAIKYNSMLKLVSVTADVNLDAGAANIFTWSNRLKPVANAFALGNGLTLYVSQTSLNQPASATNRWVNGVWMWPVVGE